ncbi:hypothetical protein HHI36_000262 [Cryptolaemus montrouzieri]|uniref:SDE2-like domain-containing protein n=1 Tax=Cryptolaemus montrouzieri TaxID=559131 RepID=A0ABD2P4H0_9CUCU
MMNIFVDKTLLFQTRNNLSPYEISNKVADIMGISCTEFYLEQNGKRIFGQTLLENGNDVKVILRLLGGKGGFGSMLRAIGAQIEKTTNREACRDLSGRRLRDINEEQRLKNWIATQAERDKEAEERKKKKLERLCQEPKHEFKNETYDKERSELPEKIEDAVLQGLQASCSAKRPAQHDKKKNKKKRKLWVDADLEDLSSSDEEEESDAESNHKNSEVSSSSDSKSTSKRINLKKLLFENFM